MASRSLSGGAKLEKYLKTTAKKLPKGATLKVGFLEGATYPDGTSVAAVAAWNEFGTSKAPPRPFFRTMIDKESGHWPDDVGAALKAADMDAPRALHMMGEEIKGELQQSIIDFVNPPLSAITVMLRGMRANDSGLEVTGATVGEAAARVEAGKTNYGASTKPLIDSGHMLNSVDYVVEKGSGS